MDLGGGRHEGSAAEACATKSPAAYHTIRVPLKPAYPGHAHDLGAATVHALEAVAVRRAAGDLLLELGRVPHHVDGLVHVKIRLSVERRKTEQVLLGLLVAALAHKPPRGFRCEEDANAEGNGPHPLQGIGHAPCPVRRVANLGLDDADANNLL